MEKTLYDVKDVAAWFLENETMTQKKLQKLCYYTQSWSYALRDEPFMDEQFEAWRHGPVSRKLWDYLGKTGLKIISQKDLQNVRPITNTSDVEFLELVWNTYGDLSANEIEALSHQEKPWQNAYISQDAKKRSDAIIDIEDMKLYYRSISNLDQDYGE